jgi:hypothetical protein
MAHRSLVALVFALPLTFGCALLDAAEVTLGASQGIPTVQGSTALDIPADYKCGAPISDPKKKYTVTTSGTQDACMFTFAQDVLAIKAADYDSKPELKGAQLIKRLDLEVTKFAVVDAAANKPLALAAIRSLDGKAFDTTILTKEDLGKKPPFTKSISGKPIDALKATVQAKKDVVIPVDVAVVVNLTPSYPAKIGLDFDAQPEIVVGF